MSKRKKTITRAPAPLVRPSRTTISPDDIAEIERFIKNEEWDSAIACLEVAERKSPMDPLVIAFLMSCSNSSSDYRTLERASWKWQQLDPNSATRMEGLIGAHASNGNLLLAGRSLDIMTNRWPKQAAASQLLQHVREMRSAVEGELAETGQRTPFDVEIETDREYVAFLADSGQSGQAQRILESITVRIPEDVLAWFSLAMSYYRDGLYSEAIRNSQRALEIEANCAEALACLVMCYIRTGNRAAAFEYAVKLRSMVTGVGLNRRMIAALALTLVQDHESVLEVYSCVVSSVETPKYQAFVSHLAAAAAWSLGDLTRARQLWEAALDLDSDLQIARNNLADLGLPAGEQFGPATLTGQQLIGEPLNAAIADIVEQSIGISADAIKRLYDRFMRKHGWEIIAISPIVYALSDELGIVVMLSLTEMTRDPALLSEAYRFAIGKRGTEDVREIAMQIVSKYAPELVRDLT